MYNWETWPYAATIWLNHMYADAEAKAILSHHSTIEDAQIAVERFAKQRLQIALDILNE
jgi:hypothetical protein